MTFARKLSPLSWWLKWLTHNLVLCNQTVYHYQLKIHFSSKVNRSEMEPSLTVSLYGTKGDAEDLQLNMWGPWINRHVMTPPHNCPFQSNRFGNSKNYGTARQSLLLQKNFKFPWCLLTGYYLPLAVFLFALLKIRLRVFSSTERTRFQRTRLIHSFWWLRRTLENFWWWNLSGRSPGAGPPPHCYRWCPLGGLVTRATTLVWRSTRSGLKSGRHRRSEWNIQIGWVIKQKGILVDGHFKRAGQLSNKHAKYIVIFS